MNVLGKRLRELREKQFLSQKRAAEIFGISNFALSRYETGSANPDPELIKKFAEYYEVATDYLLGCTDELSLIHKASNDGLDGLTFIDEEGPLTEEEKEYLKESLKLFRRMKAKWKE